MEHPIPLGELPPALHKFCDPSKPVPARMMAAKGLVPLGPGDLLTVLYQLSHDPEASVSDAASTKCKELPQQIVQGGLAAGLDARVLDYYADRFENIEAYQQLIILNHATADETVARLARKTSESLSEVVASNEQRLLRYPQIIESLYNNRNARMSTVNRLIELAVRNGITLDGIAAFKEISAAIKGELIVETEEPTPADEVFTQSLTMGDALMAAAGGDPDALDDEDGSVADAKKGLQFTMSKMSITEKIRAAMLGTAAHRAILVRDTNKMVSMAAIKSPQVNEQEAENYSRDRALSEEVVRHIANTREWTKSYRVKKNLVENPKTPLPKAMSFLIHLRDADLKSIARSKNVPQAIAQAANQQLKKKFKN